MAILSVVQEISSSDLLSVLFACFLLYSALKVSRGVEQSWRNNKLRSPSTSIGCAFILLRTTQDLVSPERLHTGHLRTLVNSEGLTQSKRLTRNMAL